MFFIACKKDNINKQSGDSISGTWELEQAQTGMIPAINYPPGNGDILKFTDSDYQVFSNNQLIKSGVYTIDEDASVQSEVCLALPADEYRNRIIYDNDYTSHKVFIQMSNNTLIFLSGCFAFDAGVYKKYTKMLADASGNIH
jgi:hypothetical protein